MFDLILNAVVDNLNTNLSKFFGWTRAGVSNPCLFGFISFIYRIRLAGIQKFFFRTNAIKCKISNAEYFFGLSGSVGVGQMSRETRRCLNSDLFMSVTVIYCVEETLRSHGLRDLGR